MAIAPEEGALLEVPEAAAAHLCHTHQPALRAGAELNRRGREVEVVKLA